MDLTQGVGNLMMIYMRVETKYEMFVNPIVMYDAPGAGDVQDANAGAATLTM